MTMAGGSTKRAVAGVIDSGGVYASRAASGGGYVFLTGTPIDETGGLPAAAQPPAPYQGSEAARARTQTRYMMDSLKAVLPQLGSSTSDLVQLENYVGLKTHVDGLFRTALTPAYLEQDRPTAATAQVGAFFPPGAAISVTGFAIAPDEASGFVREFPGSDPAQRVGRQFNEMLAVGPYAFTTYFPTDNVTGIHPEVRTEDWNWRGSEIRSEAEYGVKVMTEKLANLGATLADIVNYTLFLADVGDLYEFDLAFGKALGDAPASRTVIPALGFATPRREGALGHAEGALRMEAQFRILRPGQGAERVVVAGPGAGFGVQSAGVRVGPLLWLSGQYGEPANFGSSLDAEIADAFGKLEAVCANGGTSLPNLLRLRAVVRHPDDALAVFAALRRAVPKDPPAVSIIVTPSVLPVPEASVMIDGVAFVEGA
jgi:enamine deaminase RidA (YjgF/YER057c/UK114 family)